MKNLSDFFYAWRKELVTLLVTVGCLFLAVKFPLDTSFQFVLRVVFFLLVLPILYIKMILKRDVKEFGLNFSSPKNGLFWAFIMLLASFLIALALFHFGNLKTHYFIPFLIVRNFWAFVFYEAVIIPIVLFLLEFFFHGFVQTILEEHFHYLAPVIQFVIFLTFLFSIGKLSWQYAPIIIVSLTGGIATYKSKSFTYSYLASIIFILFLDLYMIELNK